jgi:hypothetical protein
LSQQFENKRLNSMNKSAHRRRLPVVSKRGDASKRRNVAQSVLKTAFARRPTSHLSRSGKLTRHTAEGIFGVQAQGKTWRQQKSPGRFRPGLFKR